MYPGLLHSHSYLRYAVLALLILVIVTSLMGWLGKKPYTNTNNKLSLFLLIATHLQFLVGLILYFVSPFVQFNSSAMKDSRYWTVEHVSMMIIAVALITAARSTAKKMTLDEPKHKRLFIFNSIALLIILASIAMSGRGII